MSYMDTVFVVLATFQVIAVAFLIIFALQTLETLKRAQRQAQPAMNEAKALAAIGKAMATHARDDGQHAISRVKGVVDKVRQRVDTTKRIALELKPAAAETTSILRARGTEIAHHTRSLSDIARRLARVKTAAESAVEAARVPPSAEGAGGER